MMCFEVTCGLYTELDGREYRRGDRLFSEVELDKKYKNAFKRVARLFTPREKVAQKLEAKKKLRDRLLVNLQSLRLAAAKGGFDEERQRTTVAAEAHYGELEAEVVALQKEHDAAPDTAEDRIATVPALDLETKAAYREQILREEALKNSDFAKALAKDPRNAKILEPAPTPPAVVKDGKDVALAARGTDVTKTFFKVNAAQFSIYQRGEVFHVYEVGARTPINAKGLKANEVDVTIEKFLMGERVS